MECPAPRCQTLLQNSKNHSKQNSQEKAMEKFQEVILKLAETLHPNAPLIPARRTLLQDRLNQFVSQYKTPDHPPYSAMIERALRELNEKGGSSEDSISKFLQKGYDNLPYAHSMLLKHHLEILCESGDMVATRDKKYMLSGENENPRLNSRAKKVKKKRPKRKWRWAWERDKSRQRKKHLIKKRNRSKGEKANDIEKLQESDEKEQQLPENGVHSEDKQVKEDHTERSLSFVEREHENKQSEIMEADVIAAHSHEQQEREQSEYNQSELFSPERPPGFESIAVENLASGEESFESNRARRQMRRWSRRFPEPSKELVTSHPDEYRSSGLEHPNLETPHDQQKTLDSNPITVEQIPQEKQQLELLRIDDLEVLKSVMDDTKLMVDKKYGRRRKTKSKKSENIVIDSPKLSLTLNQPECPQHESHELLQEPSPQKEEIPKGKQPRRSPRVHLLKHEVARDANVVGLLPSQHCPEECPKTFSRCRGRPSKQKLENQSPLESENILIDVSMKLDHPTDSPKLSLTLNQRECPLSNEHESQEILQGKQPRRSPRVHLAKPEAAKDANVVGLLPPQHSPVECPKTFRSHRGRPSKQTLDNQSPLESIKAVKEEALLSSISEQNLKEKLPKK